MATVIQTTETGEEFAVFSDRRPDVCDDWIEDNEEKFPESRFRVIDRYAPTAPRGYSAEELERDNPFNAWMYE